MEMSLKERKQLLLDAVNFKKTSRIPTSSNYWTWEILDAGYTLSEGICDYDKLYDAVTRFHKVYGFDFYNYIGDRNPVRVAEAAGGNSYILDDEREVLSLKDRCYMKEDEYPLLIENPIKFFWTNIIGSAATAFKGPGAEEAFLKTVQEMNEYNAVVKKMLDTYLYEFGVPDVSVNKTRSPLEMIMNIFRGITNMSIDMRRRFSEVKAACEAIEAATGLGFTLAQLEQPSPDEGAFDVSTTFLAHSICNRKQFEELFWPSMKKVLDKCCELNRVFYIFCEAEFLRFKDYIADAPKGTILFAPEVDDVFEFRKALPNVALAGGMSPKLLGGGTKEECIEFAKKLVNELGQDGGFIMSQTKMMSYRNDAKAENVLAVQEFCNTYTG